MEKCFSLNSLGPSLLAKICNKYNKPFMTFSSDLVFGGDKHSPYVECDKVNPLNVYGRSKAQGEIFVTNEHSSALIIRTSAFFGPWDKANFAYYIAQSLQENKTCEAASDVIISPTYVPDLVNNSLDLFIDGEQGVWHITNDGYLSWADFALQIAKQKCYDDRLIIRKSMSEMGWKAQRPEYSVLQSERGIKLPSLDNALNTFFKEQEVFN